MSTTTQRSRGLYSAVALAVTLSLSACTKTRSTTPPDSEPSPAPVAKPVAAAEANPEPVAVEPAVAYPEPPPPSQAKPFNFPAASSFTLPNKLVVYVVENHEVPVVAVQLAIRAGSMDREHVAEFTAAMLGEGTRSRTKANLDAAIEFVGGTLWAGSDVHTTFVSARVLAPDIKLALTLMADEVMNPVFPEEALAKLKEQAKTSIAFNKSQPEQLASALFGMVAYPEGHPYGRAIPTDAQIDAIALADIRQFHETFYRSSNAFLIVAGDITPKQAEPLVKRAFGGWKPADDGALPPNPLNQFKAYEVPRELVIHLVDRPGSTQSEIIVGNLSIARSHADWAKLQVANTILGDNASGRLFTDIREKKGLTYGIYSEVSPGQAPGTFAITTRTRTKTTGEMLAAIFGHIKQVRTTVPTQSEFDGVLKQMVGSFPLEIETADQIAGRLRESMVYDLPQSYWRDYRDQLASVSPADVKAVAQKYIHPVPHVVVVGRADKVEPQLAKVFPKAKIVKYDANLAKLK